MRLIKLVHPVLGLCCQEVITDFQTVHKIKIFWKHRYGKKYNECTVEVDPEEEIVIPIDNIRFIKPDKYSKLTEQTIYETLRLLQKGYDNKIVASQVGISVSTVSRIKKNKKDTRSNKNKPYYTQELIKKIA